MASVSRSARVADEKRPTQGLPANDESPVALTVTSFPTWVYHRTEKPRLLHTVTDFHALGAGWADTPAAFTQKGTR
jgi:hypothetical protein